MPHQPKKYKTSRQGIIHSLGLICIYIHKFYIYIPMCIFTFICMYIYIFTYILYIKYTYIIIYVYIGYYIFTYMFINHTYISTYLFMNKIYHKLMKLSVIGDLFVVSL